MLVYNSSLPISPRIKHKILIMVYKALRYLPSLLSQYPTLSPTISRLAPLFLPIVLCVIPSIAKNLRAFVLAIPSVWNVLVPVNHTVQFISPFSSLLNITSEKSVILPKIVHLLPHHSLFSSPPHSRC